MVGHNDDVGLAIHSPEDFAKARVQTIIKPAKAVSEAGVSGRMRSINVLPHAMVKAIGFRDDQAQEVPTFSVHEVVKDQEALIDQLLDLSDEIFIAGVLPPAALAVELVAAGQR